MHPGSSAGEEGAAPRAARARTLRLRAPAKVNLHLEILRRRRDGYHEIETVLQAVELFDELEVALLRELRGEPEILLAVEPAGAAPEGQENICWQAVRHFCHRQRRSGRFRIRLRKEIPVAAGLGGGSSDGAAVLVACDRLLGTGLETAELEALGAGLGSDVPFFVRGGTALARGRGTELTPLPAIRRGRFLIVSPPLQLSTRDVYDGLKMGLTVRAPRANIQGLKSLIARFPTGSWIGFNRLEEVVLPAHPELQRLVLRLREAAPVAMLSGSGAAVVAVFATETEREIEQLQAEFAHIGWFVRVVGPHTAGVEVREDPSPGSDAI